MYMNHYQHGAIPPSPPFGNFSKWQKASKNCSLLRYCELLLSFKFPELPMEEEEEVAWVAAKEVEEEEEADALVRITAGRIM